MRAHHPLHRQLLEAPAPIGEDMIKTSTRSFGQEPSQGMVPLPTRSRMSPAAALTSS
jgi:hypothetical protein